jgi:uncharacterized protein involved in type VI secretion and phage assembly
MLELETLRDTVRGKRWFGVYPATVTDLEDPRSEGRVRVRLPWTGEQDGTGYEAWARRATLFGGPDRGAWFQPDVNEEVLVGFLGGDPRQPFVIGSMWNGQDAPPESASNDNHVKSLVSREDIRVTMDDTPGSLRLQLKTPQQEITIDDGGGSIKLQDANGNSVTLDSSGVKVASPATVKVEASMVEISAGQVTVNSGMSKFSGVVQADTVITNSVVSTSYTPGAGNVW